MILNVPWKVDEFDNPEILWAHMVISALQAGYWPSEMIIGFA
jgi:hypothetical protein